jgi:hypothetical protein
MFLMNFMIRFFLLSLLISSGLLTFGCTKHTPGPNRAPVAKAGIDLYVSFGIEVQLDGSESYDPDGSNLNYQWDIVAAPAGASADIEQASSSTANFTPDKPGVWSVRLVVSDGLLASLPDVVQVYVDGPCEDDQDCDDQESCTTNSCNGGVCVFEPVADGVDCNDGLYCTVTDKCLGGQCIDTQERDCSGASDQCNVGVCNEDSDGCERQPVEDDTDCGDLVCNDLDLVQMTCQAGECSSSRIIESCDDGEQCTFDECDPTDGCLNTPMSAGDDCGVCSACDDQGNCVSDLSQDDECPLCQECASGGVCVNQEAGSDVKLECIDGTFCDGVETCDGGGNCTQDGPDPCTGLECDENLGACVNCTSHDQCPFCQKCSFQGVCVNQDHDEDLKEECAGDDCNNGHCDGFGACCVADSGTPCGNQTPQTECDQADVCDGNGSCVANYKPFNSPCGDQNLDCNVDDYCNGSGLCLDQGYVQNGDSCGSPDDPECDNPDSCLDGQCQDNFEPEGTLCGDIGVDCLVDDTCDDSGNCINNGFVSNGNSCGSDVDTDCDDPDTCLGGVCQDNYLVGGTPCAGGNADYCDSTCDGLGSCSDLVGVDCSDGIECTEDLCNSGDGTCSNPPLADGTPCDGGDSNWCNSACDSTATCAPASIECPDDGVFCNGTESCEPSDGSCVWSGNLGNSDFCDGSDLVTCNGSGGEIVRSTCPFGCDGSSAPAVCSAAMIDPSNLGQTGRDNLCANSYDLDLTADAIIDTDNGTIDGDSTNIVFATVGQGGSNPDIGVFAFNSVRLQAGATLKVTGANALAIIACSDMQIEGVIDIRGGDGLMTGDGTGAHEGYAGPGGWAGGDTNYGDGQGQGGGAAGDDDTCGSGFYHSGGAGGSYGGVGGAGGDGRVAVCRIYGPTPTDADRYGSIANIALMGGSGGGAGGDNWGGPGGGGGGAIQLSANGTLTIAAGGGINAGGGAGAGGRYGTSNSAAGGGGGSGGAILLEAKTLRVLGVLACNGGGGGAGYEAEGISDPDHADDGTAGTLDDVAAPGGVAAGFGGNGGQGSAGTVVNGSKGQGDDTNGIQKGGGGGGAAGRIRLNSSDTTFEVGAQTIVSPSNAANDCTGLCHTGNVAMQ